jgi:hypothetical protein
VILLFKAINFVSQYSCRLIEAKVPTVKEGIEFFLFFIYNLLKLFSIAEDVGANTGCYCRSKERCDEGTTS